MQKNALHIVWLASWIGLTSIVYFFGLIIHFPIWAIAWASLISGLGLYVFLPKEKENQETWDWKNFLAYTYVIIGSMWFIYQAFLIAEKDGGWDAWAIWNLHAAYLSDAGNWNVYLNIHADAHPDYPLLVPASIAFFSQTFHADIPIVSFTLSLFITLAIPLIIFFTVFRKNIWVAIIAAAVIGNKFFIAEGVSRYADIYLSFYFLAAIICIDVFKKEQNKKYLFLSALLIGCCIWIKNEGIMLMLLFFLFHFKNIFNREGLKFFLAGIVLPLLSWSIFKTIYAPTNDLVQMTGSEQLRQITDSSRWKLILEFLKNELQEHYLYCIIAFFLSVLISILDNKRPDKNFLLLLSGLAGYIFVFLITPQNLEWQLDTSLNRLLLHLAPAFIYATSIQIAELRVIPKKFF